MARQREIELKLELGPKGVSALKNGALSSRVPLGEARQAELVSVYYDTPKQKLRRNDLTLRIRRIGDQYLQTIKHEAGAHEQFGRDEWERPVSGPCPKLGRARGKGPKPLRKKNLPRKLKPVFETSVQRTTYDFAVGPTHIELALDEGAIVAGDRHETVAELELELKSGAIADLFRLARLIGSVVPVQLGARSKAQRGYALAAGEAAESVKSLPMAITRKQDCAAAFQTIGRTCIDQLNLNRPLVLQGHPDALHQARVALRRLRSAISLFSRMLDDPQTDRIKADLKWLGSAFGRARELDVLRKKLASERPEAGGNLLRVVEDERDAAFAAAKDVIEEPRFRRIAIATLAWIEAGDWLHSEEKKRRAARKQGITMHATRELKRRNKKILKAGRNLTRMEPEARHRLRIRIKKLRYASEFFSGELSKSAKERKNFASRLEALQDCLGALNDIEANRRLMAQVMGDGHDSPGEAAPPLAAEDDVDALLVQTEKTFASFRKAKPFWR